MNDTQPYRKTLLRAVGLTKRFGDLAAVSGVDFDVPRHGIVSMIGPNGAGKTVFFNILTGLIKPDSGEIWFNGENITGQPPDRITRLGMARTFQGIRLFKNMTVLENVMVGQHTRMSRGLLDVVMSSPEMKSEERAAKRDANAKNLPYGIQRRVEVARALATTPHLLLLDEPTAGMNPSETASMIDLIGRLSKDMGLAVLLIEHDMRVVMRISERVSVLEYGVKIAEGTPHEIRRDARVIEAYLGRTAAAERELNPPDDEGESVRSPDTSPQVSPKPATG
jgi:branched-chain amino acid transport system ATP-binding protein